MTSIEHANTFGEHEHDDGHAGTQLPDSSSGDRVGNREEVEVRDEVRSEAGEAEIEEVGVGVAVTTASDDEEVAIVVIGDEQDPHSGHPHPYLRAGDASEGGLGSAVAIAGRAPSLSRRVGPTARLASRSNSGSNSGSGSGSNLRSNSRSPSRSQSQSQSRSWSRSQSHSSLKRALEMGESSSATSWTHADVEGSGGERPSDETCCLSSVEGPTLKEDIIDVETGEGAKEAKEETVVSLSHVSANTGTMGLVGGTEAAAGVDAPRREVILVTQEEDITEGWHPLRHRGKAPLLHDAVGEKEEEEDVASVHALESLHGGDRSSETNEKERWRSFGSTGRNSRHLRLEFKRPSPQPWDEQDPPPDHHDPCASDYYSTLNSKKFEAMQKSRRRPLIPHSSYYFGPPPPDSAYGTPPVGQIGIHHPREIVRVERDYVGGEVIQFSPIFPLELEGRITPTQFHQTINDINEILISAHSIHRSVVDNLLAVVTLQLSTLMLTSHYTREMRRLKRKINELNAQQYNPVGLHILWPRKVAFLFLEIEYY